jgi:hypothetical protein
MGVGAMTHLVGFLTTQQSINNSTNDHLIVESEGKEVEAQDAAKNAEKDVELAHKSLASTISMASSAVSVAKAGANVGSEAGKLSDRIKTENKLEGAMGDAQAGQGTAELKDVKLGEDGHKVGDRFNDNQIKMLTDSKTLDSQIVRGKDGKIDEKAGIANIQKNSIGPNGEPGFTENEAKDLLSDAKDGDFDADKAADYMWTHRQTEPEAKAEAARSQFREKLFQGIQQQTEQGVNRDLNLSASMYSKYQKKVGDEAGKHREIAEKAGDLMVDGNKKLGDIALASIKGKQGSSSQSQR